MKVGDLMAAFLFNKPPKKRWERLSKECKVGDLVSPKDRQFYQKDVTLGTVVKVEKDHFSIRDGTFQDGLTIQWTCGITSLEPSSYVEGVND